MAAQKRTRLVEAAAATAAASSQNYDENENMDEIVEILEEELQPRRNNGIRFLAETLRSTLLEIAEVKEQNQERRHKELIHLLEKYFSQENTDKTVEIKTVESELDPVVEPEPATQTSSPKDTTLEDVRELLKSSSAVGKAPDEFLQMRENMLEIQRQKMAERKYRKRKMELK